MEREAWQVTVHRVTQSRTRLEQLSIHRHKVFLLLPGAYPLLSLSLWAYPLSLPSPWIEWVGPGVSCLHLWE